jgi:hypothetical protein
MTPESDLIPFDLRGLSASQLRQLKFSRVGGASFKVRACRPAENLLACRESSLPEHQSVAKSDYWTIGLSDHQLRMLNDLTEEKQSP